MAITFLQAKKRQRYLVLILALVVMAILVVVWQGFSKGERAPLSPAVPSLTPQKIMLNWSTLKDPKIETLKTFDQILPFEGEVGRKNPFTQY